MIDWKNHLLGKEVIIHTKDHGAFEGIFEGVQELGNEKNPFHVLKIEGEEREIEGKYVLIPEKLVERIYVVSDLPESGISSKDGEGAGTGPGEGDSV